MEVREISGCKVLIAEEGKKIMRNGNVYGYEVWLSTLDNAEGYTEIDIQEAERIEKEREQEARKKREERHSATSSQRGEEQRKEELPIEAEKARKIAEIEDYSNSSNVNDLTFKGLHTWVTPAVRANYLVSLDAAELLGEKDITFVVEGVQVTLAIAKVRIILAQIQRYADACYIVTEGHKRAVRALENVDEVRGYDFTKGYPNKLNF